MRMDHSTLVNIDGSRALAADWRLAAVHRATGHRRADPARPRRRPGTYRRGVPSLSLEHVSAVPAFRGQLLPASGRHDRRRPIRIDPRAVSYTHLRAHETRHDLV